MSKITLIVNATLCPNGTEALAHYSKHAGEILKNHGGKLIAKYSIEESLTEKHLEKNIMLMEFEDDSIIKALSKGEAYQALIPYRNKAFSEISIAFAQIV